MPFRLEGTPWRTHAGSRMVSFNFSRLEEASMEIFGNGRETVINRYRSSRVFQ